MGPASGQGRFLAKAFEANVVQKNETTDGSVEHAKVRIGDSILECSEAHGQWGPRTATMHLYVPDVDAVYERVLKSNGQNRRIKSMGSAAAG